MSAVLWLGAVLLLVLILLPRAGRGDWQSVILRGWNTCSSHYEAPERGHRRFRLRSSRVTAATRVETPSPLFAPGAR